MGGLGLADMDRFSEPALLLLLCLADGEKHGYAMMERIKDDHGIDIGPGTLYGALARLEKRGYIEGLPSIDRRRPYRLTPGGVAMLQEQLLTLRRVADVGLRRLAEA